MTYNFITASGPQGVQGTPGASANFYPYKANTLSFSGNPGNNYISWNNSSQTSATTIFASHLDANNIDIDVYLELFKIGDTLIVQDSSDSDNYQKFTISSTPTVIANSYATLPVTFDSSGGTGSSGFANDANLILIIFSLGINGPQGNQGNIGLQGNQGYQGVPGSAASVSLTAGSGLVATPTTITGTGSYAANFGTTSGTITQGNDNRLNPTPSGIGKIPYDTGSSAYSVISYTSFDGYVLTSNTSAVPSWRAPAAQFTGTGIGFYRAISATNTGSWTAATDYLLDVTYTSGPVTLTLPDASSLPVGRCFAVKLSSTVSVTVSPFSVGQTIDGAASLVFSTQYVSYTFMCTGSKWIII